MLITSCQLCGSQNLEPIIDLGLHPLADTFLKPEDLKRPERTYPLCVMLCQSCGYATLKTVVPAKKRYAGADYSYTSSNSPVAIKHFEEMAAEITRRANITSKDLVVDIGSNVGTLLGFFRKRGQCAILGVEPAPNIATVANQGGVPTMERLFDEQVVDEILQRHGKAKVITATNVYNHITDLNAFMAHIARLLTSDGVFVFEVPYLLTLVETRAFDTIYLEHVSYFAVKPCREFFKEFELYIERLQTNEYMGGSIRVYVGRGPESPEVAHYVVTEERAGISKTETYQKFMRDIRRLKKRVLEEIREIKEKGEKIIGIGAASKGNTFLNYCGIDHSMLEFVTDNSPLKIGKYTPVSRIPIKGDGDITSDIHYALILSWNIAKFLIEKLEGKNLEFIVPKYENMA